MNTLGGAILSSSSQCSPGTKICDKESVFSEKLMSLTLDEIMEINRTINNSDNLFLFNRINEILKMGHKLNLLEQKVFDDVVETYNNLYKSPLAKVLKENE